MRETTTAVPPLAWSRTYPGRADHVGEARRFLASVLDDWPSAYDAILCLSELAANAVTHSNSREPGGQFTIRASVRHRNRVRVEVEDQGGPWINPACTDGQHGRGLFIVSQLASDWGISGDGRGGWTVWFEIACPLSGCSVNGNCSAGRGGPSRPALGPISTEDPHVPAGRILRHHARPRCPAADAGAVAAGTYSTVTGR
jgi:anti-sigma regulatory factor (Ser/Thr protein kinase)